MSVGVGSEGKSLCHAVLSKKIKNVSGQMFQQIPRFLCWALRSAPNRDSNLSRFLRGTVRFRPDCPIKSTWQKNEFTPLRRASGRVERANYIQTKPDNHRGRRGAELWRKPRDAARGFSLRPSNPWDRSFGQHSAARFRAQLALNGFRAGGALCAFAPRIQIFRLQGPGLQCPSRGRLPRPAPPLGYCPPATPFICFQDAVPSPPPPLADSPGVGAGVSVSLGAIPRPLSLQGTFVQHQSRSIH